MHSLLICPYCKSEVINAGDRTYKCESNHSFDLSKEGYFNLLPVNKKKSKSPGDNELMIAARRTFLEQGFYDPLIEGIRELIANELKVTNPYSALDSGCGDGYYSQHALQNKSNSHQILGTDISKYAVKSAAKKYKEGFYFVSSIYQLPIASNSIDLILSVFAPNHPSEFNRILTSEGYLIVVSPAPNHMKQLAELIYDNFRPHEHKIEQQLSFDFKLHSTKRVSFDIEIKNAETLAALHKMTPYYYNTSITAQEKIANCNNIIVSCDFYISVFQPLLQ